MASGADNGSARYVANPNLKSMREDVLYHLNMSTKTHDLKSLFGDVKFVCVGGSPGRMLKLAEYFAEELSAHISKDITIKNLTGSSDRYVMYKVGPVLTASHGIGVPSMSVLLNELFKLLSHAGASDVTIFRLGTSGGLGVDPGTVVITTQPLNGLVEPVFEQFILGRRVVKTCVLDQRLVEDLKSCAPPANEFPVITGKTMCANDFYTGQARIDGAICDYTEKDKMEFLQKLHGEGVRNIEMECNAFAVLTQEVKLTSAIVCVTLLDRLIDDQVNADHATLKSYEMRPAKVVARYMLKQLNQKK